MEKGHRDRRYQDSVTEEGRRTRRRIRSGSDQTRLVTLHTGGHPLGSLLSVLSRLEAPAPPSLMVGMLIRHGIDQRQLVNCSFFI